MEKGSTLPNPRWGLERTGREREKDPEGSLGEEILTVQGTKATREYP
jgi:hypothetical protein